MKKRVEFRTAAIGSLAATAALVAGVTLTASTAVAQDSGLYGDDNPNVTVDMSVLEGGSSATAKSFPQYYSGRLAVPGPAAPLSRLYVAPSTASSPLPPPEKGRVVMTPPSGPSMPPEEPPESTITTTVEAPPAPTPTPVPAPKPTAPAAPEPTVAAKPPAPAPAAPPAPAPAPPPKPAVAEAPTEPAKAPPPPAVAAPAPPTTKPEPPAVEPPKTDVATAEPKEQASTPPTGAAVETGSSVRVVFEAGATKLPDEARDKLKAIVESVSDKTNLRLQLLAYAGGESLSSSKARRLSLSRALSVRSYLIESGLRSTRIDVRALGNKTTEEPVNRVDINIVER